MTQLLAIAIATASFLLSLYTLWFTQLRRGRLKMTQPTLVFFGREGKDNQPKIFLRTLLFSTADKGCVIENMHLRIHNGYGVHLFDFWGYGERELVKGSGLFVPRNGVAFNHHFVLSRKEQQLPHEEQFQYVGGDYRIEVFAKSVGRTKPVKLMELKMALVGNQGPTVIQVLDSGVFFEWDIDTETYIGRVERLSNFSFTAV